MHLAPRPAPLPGARPPRRAVVARATPIGLANDAERRALAAFGADGADADARAGELLARAAKDKVQKGGRVGMVRVCVCGRARL